MSAKRARYLMDFLGGEKDNCGFTTSISCIGMYFWAARRNLTYNVISSHGLKEAICTYTIEQSNAHLFLHLEEEKKNCWKEEEGDMTQTLSFISRLYPSFIYSW